jgi:uncharacterized protein YlxW (UPF0749 family)
MKTNLFDAVIESNNKLQSDYNTLQSSLTDAQEQLKDCKQAKSLGNNCETSLASVNEQLKRCMARCSGDNMVNDGEATLPPVKHNNY